jgi:hypothetical protein
MLPGSGMLHRQYLDWERMKAKQRWYQCWEWVNRSRRALDVYRQYHHMDAVPPERFREVPDEWLGAYREAGIDLGAAATTGGAQWDAAVLDLFDEHGVERFRRLAVWEVDWPRRASELGRTARPEQLRDPRNRLDRLVHRWLRRTQGRDPLEREVYWVEKALRASGW